MSAQEKTGYFDFDNELGQLYKRQIAEEKLMHEQGVSLVDPTEHGIALLQKHQETMDRIAVVLDMGKRRKDGLGRKCSCGFERCCVNFCKGKNGNCICQMEDVLECWVDTNPSKEAIECGWAGTT